MTDAPKHAPRAPRVPFALLVTAMIVGGLALLLGLNTVSAANELRRNGLVDKDAVVAAQVEDLRNEVAVRAAPANIEAAAIALGMVPAGHPAFLMVGANGVMRVVGKPKPVQGVPLARPSTARTSAHAKPKPTATKSKAHATKTPAHSTKTPAHSTKTPARTSKSTSKSPGRAKPSPSTGRAKRTPTPTPTPVVTLSGGAR